MSALCSVESRAIQLLPQFQSQKARPELPRSFQPYPVQQDAGYLRIIWWRRHMRREQLQLLCFALFIENLNGCQPARLRGTVQLAQIAEGFPTRTIRCAHRLDQRPTGVILTVLIATVRPQKHSGLIVS
jgi:hypothetical protein